MTRIDLLSNPMTTQDDLIVGGASGVTTRLAKGADGQVLTVDPATHHLAWADPTGGGSGSLGGGSADRVPASPSAYDDEFESYSGWTNLGTPNANVTDMPGNVHLANAAPGTTQLHGIFKAAPSTPFTVTAKISDLVFEAQYQQAGIMLLETGPGKILQFGPIYPGGGSSFNLGYGIWASRTSRTSFTDNLAYNNGTAAHDRPIYIRMVVTSSTNIATWISTTQASGVALGKGYYWRSLNTAINPGFTVASVGLFVTGQDNSVNADAYFDWIRFS